MASAPRSALESEEGFVDTLESATIAVFLALLYGVVGIAGEYRHGTITPTFLATPLRERVLGAKLLVYASVGLVLVAFALLLALAMAVPWFAAKNIDYSLGDRDVALFVVGLLAAAALWGALGVAYGSVVPNQVGALVTALIWLLIIENILAGLVPEVARFTPGKAAQALMRVEVEDLLTMWAAAVVTIGYIAALAAIGATVTMRRDVT
jgi:ABC-type transport system involved in multi-copper enzyme maturation permease subunit